MLLRWLVVAWLLHVAFTVTVIEKKHKQKEDPCTELSCEHHCTSSNGAATCSCPDGFVLSEDGKSCKDINECSASIWPPKCSQMCQNTDGGYVCLCDTDHYTLINNNGCKAKGERPKLIYTSTSEIVVKILNSSLSETRISGLHSVESLSYSPFGHYIYWVDKAGTRDHVYRRGMYDAFGTPEKLASVLGHVGIAVDWITFNLYMAKGKQLLVCGFSDHFKCKTIWTSSEIISAVVVNPVDKQVFWIEQGKHIMKCSLACGLDGSSPHFVVSDMSGPRALVIDRPTRTVYWTDVAKRTIETSSIDGHNKNRKLLLKLEAAPLAVAVFEDTVYWTNGLGIYAANKFTGERQADPVSNGGPHSATQKSHHFPVDVLIAHPSIQTTETSPCVFAKCSQLGLASPTKGCVCACDDESEPMDDGATCRMRRNSPHLLLTTGEQIYQANVQTMNSFKLLATMGNEGMFDLLAYDPVSDRVLVYKSSNQTIYGLNPSNEFDIWVIFSGSSVGGIAVDEENGNVYWTVPAEGRVMATTTTNPKQPITTAHMFQIPEAIAIASKERLVFVADMECNCIFRMRLDGSEVSIVSNRASPVSMVVSTTSAPPVIIWSDIKSDSINSIEFDGTNFRSVKPFVEVGSDLVLNESTLYWLPRNATYLYSANNYGHGITNYMRIDRYIPDARVVHHMALMKPPRTLSSSCSTRSNPCEYFCTSVGDKTKCLCPNGMSLTENGKCVRSACQYGTFKCDDGCLENWHRCNGKKDCRDGSDEIDCTDKPKQCASHEFQCKNKRCIPSGWKCDGEDDCTDASDEQDCPSCPKGKWKCKTQSKCILESWLCDGREDCRDGSDEAPEQCKNFACRKNQFKCDHGGCIEMRERCDGFEDCVDKSDEKNCLRTCKNLMVSCNDGTCIPKLYQCDGDMDCPDGEDELPPVCPTPKIQNCTCPLHTHFACKETPSICLPLIKRCNGVPDCPYGTDEKQCPTYCPVSLDTQKCLQLCGKFNFPFCQKSQVTSWKVALCDQHSWQCPKSGTCIYLSKTCDGKPDCPLGEDEGERCASACYNNGGCEYRCHPTPFGPRCSCHAGYILAKDRKSCVDYDECNSIEGYCSQICIDKSGGLPMCKCAEGYKLGSDQRTCKVMGERGHLLFALNNSIRMLNLADNNLESLVTTDKKISGIGYDSRTFTVYWAEVSCNITTVRKMRIYDGVTETVTAMKGDSTSMSYDWVNSNLYISRELNPDYVITICSMKSLQCSDIMRAYGGKKITSVVVDPVNRKLFWIESIKQQMTIIQSSDLGGSNDVSLKEYTPNARSLAIDYVLSKLYWSDGVLQAILATDFDGNRTRVALTARNELSHPHAVAVFEDSVYFSNMDTPDPYEPSPACIENSNITACNKFTGERCKNMHRHHSAAHSLAITSKVLQPEVITACKESDCGGICVPQGSSGSTCIRGIVNRINGPCDVTQTDPYAQTDSTTDMKELASTLQPQLQKEDLGLSDGGLAAGITISILLLLLIGAGFLYLRNQKSSQYMPHRIPFKGLDSVLTEEDELQKQHEEMEASDSTDQSNSNTRSNKSYSWTFHKGRSRLEEEL